LVIDALGAITGGASYTDGTYSYVKLYGGTGSGAFANITVAGGAVTVVSLVELGVGYTVADVLTAILPNDGTVYGVTGAGFAVPVASLKSPITNTTY